MLRILQTLFEHEVSYTVSHTRTTQGVDLVPDPDPDNLDRLAAALHASGRAIGQ